MSLAHRDLGDESIRHAVRALRGRLALRPREVARALGVGHRTVEAWIAEGRLPVSREGRVVLVSVWDLVGFLESRRVLPPGQRPRTLRERALQFVEGKKQQTGGS